jgi:hypothetical protein
VIEASVDATDRDETAHEKARAGEHDERECDLGGDEYAARAATAGIGSAGQGRRQSEEQPTEDGGRGGNENHADIEADGLKSRQLFGTERDQGANAAPGDEQAKRASQRGERHALGEQLAHQLPRRTKGGADRYLPLPHAGARQQQVGHVDARDQQHERHSAGQNQKCRAGLADQVVVQRFELDAPVRIFGIMRFQARRDGIHLGLGPLDGGGRREPGDGMAVVRNSRDSRHPQQVEWQPYVHSFAAWQAPAAAQLLESGRHHPHDAERRIAKPDD